MTEMQIICSGVDGIKVQLSEAITRYWTQVSENGLRGCIEMGLLLWNHFVSKRWHPSFKLFQPFLGFSKYCQISVKSPDRNVNKDLHA